MVKGIMNNAPKSLLSGNEIQQCGLKSVEQESEQYIHGTLKQVIALLFEWK
jgi:hypothetical protein